MIVVSDEVREAAAVVALETTLVAHGFPAGEGVAVGLETERRVREAGAVPATIGVLDGKIRVGLTEDELARFDAERAQGRPARPRGVRRAGRRRRDDGRRNARGLPRGRHPLHGHGRARRRPPRLSRVRHRTSPPTSASSRARRRSSSPPESSRCSTSPRRSRCSRRSACRCSASARTTLPLFYSAHGGPPVSARVESAGRGRANRAGALGARRRRTSARAPTRRQPRRRRAADRGSAGGSSAHTASTGQAVTPFVLSYLHEHSGGRTLAANRELVVANAALAAEVAVSSVRPGLGRPRRGLSPTRLQRTRPAVVRFGRDGCDECVTSPPQPVRRDTAFRGTPHTFDDGTPRSESRFGQVRYRSRRAKPAAASAPTSTTYATAQSRSPIPPCSAPPNGPSRSRKPVRPDVFSVIERSASW